jgi:hypothetical protein
MTVETFSESAEPDRVDVDQACDGRPSVSHSRLFSVICTLHLTAGWIAVALAWYDVETILGTFPAILITGLLVIVPAMRRTSWLLLNYGISAFLCVAVISLVIATFNLNPGAAVPAVPSMITVYAIFQGWWYFRCKRVLLGEQGVKISRLPRLQFSIRSMLMLTTLVCVLSAIGRVIPWNNEMWMFGSVGFALLGISAMILLWFARRNRAFAAGA